MLCSCWEGWGEGPRMDSESWHCPWGLGDPACSWKSTGRHMKEANLSSCFLAPMVESGWHILEFFFFFLKCTEHRREIDIHKNFACKWEGPTSFSVLILFSWLIIYSYILPRRFYFGSQVIKAQGHRKCFQMLSDPPQLKIFVKFYFRISVALLGGVMTYFSSRWNIDTSADEGWKTARISVMRALAELSLPWLGPFTVGWPLQSDDVDMLGRRERGISRC